jgi:opacity protein-like surface antigen
LPADAVGWAVGGGMEYALTNNWIIRGEYLYMQFENKTVFDLGDGSGGVPRPRHQACCAETALAVSIMSVA